MATKMKDQNPPKHHKNRNKWCDGVEGRKHTPTWETTDKYKFGSTSEILIYVCQKCHKEIDWWYSWRGVTRGLKKPVAGSSNPLEKV